MTWWSICFLRAIGQAYDVKDKLPQGRGADHEDMPEIVKTETAAA
jgi:hypothetical protein